MFGAQCVVLAIDAKSGPARAWEVYVAGGRTPTGRDAVAWAREGVERGAGEILLTSMDRDGTNAGYDLDLTRAVSRGGAGAGHRLGRRGDARAPRRGARGGRRRRARRHRSSTSATSRSPRRRPRSAGAGVPVRPCGVNAPRGPRAVGRRSTGRLRRGAIDEARRDFAWFDDRRATAPSTSSCGWSEAAPDWDAFGPLEGGFVTPRNVVYQDGGRTIIDWFGQGERRARPRRRAPHDHRRGRPPRPRGRLPLPALAVRRAPRRARAAAAARARAGRRRRGRWR